jgi:hypothetical protein
MDVSAAAMVADEKLWDAVDKDRCGSHARCVVGESLPLGVVGIPVFVCHRFRLDIPLLDFHFTGTGDMCIRHGVRIHGGFRSGVPAVPLVHGVLAELPVVCSPGRLCAHRGNVRRLHTIAGASSCREQI